MLFYRLGNNNQTGQRDEMEGFEMDRVERERLEREGVKVLYFVQA
jgi:hypothetical protein